jgi:lipoate-protein ligase A
MDSWYLMRSAPCASPLNMAVDETLLLSMPRLERPVLRFYGWIEPAATFGYFQKFQDVESLTALRPLIRRPTAGGIVPHDKDWTYSLAFPAGHEWYALKAVESYRRVHEWLQSAFAHLGVETEVAPCCAKAAPGQCFIGHEQYDLLWQGRKIAGAAQRRTRLGLLIQGSVQPPPLRITRRDWENSFCRSGPGAQVTWVSLDLDSTLRGEAEALAAKRYALDSYNQKR